MKPMVELPQRLARWRLRFPSPHEALFQSFYSRRFRQQMRLGLFLCFLGLCAVPLFQWIFLPELLWQHWNWRGGNYLALLFLIGLAYSPFIKRYHQWVMAAAAFLVTLHVLLLTAISPEYLRYSALSGMSLSLIIAAALLRLQFRFFMVYCLLFVALNGFWLWNNEANTVLRNSALVWQWLGVLLTLVLNWFLERGVRRSYLQLRLLEIEKAESNAANRELQRLSERDELTNVANRRRFEQALDQEWRRAIRAGSPLSLLMVDVDYFKRYNDHYGHQAGDECLRRLAQAMALGLQRSGELVARYGGEEFAVVLPETGAQGALQVAERLLQAVRDLKIAHADSAVDSHVSISVGVNSVLPQREHSASELVAGADRAVYAAKHAGRNRAVLAS